MRRRDSRMLPDAAALRAANDLQMRLVARGLEPARAA